MALTTAESNPNSISSASNVVGTEPFHNDRRGSPSSVALSSWLPNRRRILEVIVLSCVIIGAWGLLLVPTIVYALSFPLQHVSYRIYVATIL